MTPKEKASWQRWHESGRHRYQLRAAARAAVMIPSIIALNLLVAWILAFFEIDRHVTINPVTTLLTMVAWGTCVYFFAGHHWDAREEEYRWLTEHDSQA